MERAVVERLGSAEAHGFMAYAYLTEMRKDAIQARASELIVSRLDSALADLAKCIYRLEDSFGDKSETRLYGSPDVPNLDRAEELRTIKTELDRTNKNYSNSFFSDYLIVIQSVTHLINECTTLRSKEYAVKASGHAVVCVTAASHWARKALDELRGLSNAGIPGSDQKPLILMLRLDLAEFNEQDENFYAKMNGQDPEVMYKTHKQQVQKAKETYAAMAQRAEDRNSSSSGCYIATAVYGSYDCSEVWTLRRFRDYRLSKTKLGRAFIRTYYRISPQLVAHFGGRPWFIKPWRLFLDRLVSQLNKQGYSSAPYED